MKKSHEFPSVSIIIPARNEIKWIEKCLGSLSRLDYPADFFEILIVDGMSTDGTKELIDKLAVSDQRIRVFSNPDRTVPFALNIAIRAAHGEVIVRMDAHAEYPSDYLRELIKWQIELDADNVGAAWDIVPSNNSTIAESIAAAMSSRFSAGNAHYRFGVDEVCEVDTVPFGCYRRSVFERIGLFDIDMTRNQDDEFNARLKKNGGRIYLVPNLKITYYARDRLGKLAKMYYEYGYFKPLANKKLQSVTTTRQLIPPLFVLYVFSFAVSSIFSNIALYILILTLVLHLFFGVFNAVYAKGVTIPSRALMPFVFMLIHASYGLGYLRGVLDFCLLRRTGGKDLGINR